MFREDDLKIFVGTIGAALSGPIMADLKSDAVRGIARGLLEMLDRLSSDLRDGDPLAVDAQRAWGALASAAAVLESPQPAVDGDRPRHRFDDEVLALQSTIAREADFDHLVARVRAGDPATRLWMDETATLFAGFHREMENSYARMAARPSLGLGGSDPEALKQRLIAYLAARFPVFPADPVTAFALVAGGNSKLTALFSLVPNDVLPEYLVLRLDIANSITGARLEDEFPVLERVVAMGLPVPRPHVFEPDPSHLGGAFILMEQIRDVQIAGSPFPEDRRRFGSTMGPEFGIEAARVIGKLHGQTLEESKADPDLAKRLADDIGRLYAEWRTLEKPPHSLSVDLGVAWMLGHPLPAIRPTCLLHGDIAPHNFLTRDGHLVALLDWELSRRGDPAEDLAQVKMMLIDGVIDWPDFVAAYIDAGGPSAGCDDHAIAYYQQFVYLRHGVNQTRLRGCYLRGERSDLSAALVASHYQDRITLYQSLALKEATALGL